MEELIGVNDPSQRKVLEFLDFQSGDPRKHAFELGRQAALNWLPYGLGRCAVMPDLLNARGPEDAEVLRRYNQGFMTESVIIN
ncbi:hypothetical protein GF362_03860 [Candidatus Dojkabacteria bacterium]|nr:hypothetical protein [Candidatus Dojkabacteria bacterium]